VAAMFGFGLKAKAEKIVEENLGYFVSPMFRNRFNHIVSLGKSSGKNEYSIAIEFVLYSTEHLESVWSEETGKVTKKEIIQDIKERCRDIELAIHLSNNPENQSKERIASLLSKIKS